jgi:6-phosphogluconolactonase
MHDIRIFENRGLVSRALAEAFVDAALEASGRFSVALAGGRTPRLLYELLATECLDVIPWKKVHFFWSDERYVPPDHPDSNQLMACETLLDHVPVLASNIHRPPTTLDDPEEAARLYETEIHDPLDWMLLGLGEDGHLASLFPGSPALEVNDRSFIVVRDSPKPPPLRLTVTLPLINRSTRIHFIVSGKGKAEALRSTLEGPPDPGRWPAQNVKPRQGSLTWWVDEEAAHELARMP